MVTTFVHRNAVVNIMINKNEIKVEYMRGTGPGGQNAQKNETACMITHIASGIQSYCYDERSRLANYKKAFKELELRIKEAKDAIKASIKKEKRDIAIHDHTVVRTYNIKRNEVKDHRTGKTASIKDILTHGKLEKLR